MRTMDEIARFVDHRGFIHSWPSNFTEAFILEEVKRNEVNSQKWTQYLESIGGIDNLDYRSSQVKQLIRMGIPDEYRPTVWCRISGCSNKIAEAPELYLQLLGMVDGIPEITQKDILKDVPRTFPGSLGFQPEQLENVLKAFSLMHPEIRYCQGLNFIAGLLISVVGEAQAFYMLCTLVEDYLPKNYYCDDMAGFRTDLQLLDTLIEERVPDLYKLSVKFRYDWFLTSSGWVLTLFSNSFPVSTVLRIWDSFFLEGHKIVFRTAIAFLRINQDTLLASKDLSKLSSTLTSLQGRMVDQDSLMSTAFSLKLFSRDHLDRIRSSISSKLGQRAKASPKSLHSIFGQLNC